MIHPTTAPGPALAAADVTLAYEQRVIARDVSLRIPEGTVTAIIGPNACGKSTLLRGFARQLAPRGGHFELRGRQLEEIRSRQVARELAFLPQESTAPPGILVRDLVARGRYPHQTFLAQASPADLEAVGRALRTVGLEAAANHPVDQLSGGQRQRAWIAMILAQDTPLLLLDEPTTFLDLTHQIELLDLTARLNRDHARTVVMVLHDLNQAARYADALVVMKDGRIVAHGSPHDVLDAALVEEVFGVPCRVIPDPETGSPLVIPRAPATSAAREHGRGVPGGPEGMG